MGRSVVEPVVKHGKSCLYDCAHRLLDAYMLGLKEDRFSRDSEPQRTTGCPMPGPFQVQGHEERSGGGCLEEQQLPDEVGGLSLAVSKAFFCPDLAKLDPAGFSLFSAGRWHVSQDALDPPLFARRVLG